MVRNLRLMGLDFNDRNFHAIATRKYDGQKGQLYVL